MKKLLILPLAMALSLPVLADSDKLRTSDGVTCEQATDTGKRVYAEGYGSQGNGEDNYYNNGYNNYGQNYDDELGVKVGVEIRFGGAERIDCTVLYRYEIRKQKRDGVIADAEHEIKLLELQVKKRRMINELNSGSQSGMTLTNESL